MIDCRAHTLSTLLVYCKADAFVILGWNGRALGVEELFLGVVIVLGVVITTRKGW
jgi:hypothetical protein